jgi:predicted nucleotidyltransferase
MNLEGLLARLSRHHSVSGIVLVGSTGTDALTATSDYDLLVVIDEPELPLLVGLTTVDDRLTDLLFATTSEVEALLSGTRPEADAWPARIARWVISGRIVFDRTARLEKLRQVLADSPGDGERMGTVHETWFSLNYDLAQNRRLSGSTDPLDRAALHVRLLRGVSEHLTGYFRLNGLEWPGEKAAIRYLAAHDPEYLTALRACLDEPEPERRFEHFKALAGRTLGPFGGVWQPGETNFQFRPGSRSSPELIRRASAFWASIVSD